MVSILLGNGKMRSKRLVSASLGFLSFAGLAMGCGPSIDGAAKVDIDQRMAGLRAPTNIIVASDSASPMPFSPGQWAQYKITKDKAEPAFVTFSIVSGGAGTFWFQTVRESYKGRSSGRFLVAFRGPADAHRIEILAVQTTQPSGRVHDAPASTLPILQSTFGKTFETLFASWKGLPQEAAVVPAGRFEGSFQRRAVTYWAGVHGISDSWSHPAVPIFGLVRSVGIEKPYDMELVAFDSGPSAK